MSLEYYFRYFMHPTYPNLLNLLNLPELLNLPDLPKINPNFPFFLQPYLALWERCGLGQNSCTFCQSMEYIIRYAYPALLKRTVQPVIGHLCLLCPKFLNLVTPSLLFCVNSRSSSCTGNTFFCIYTYLSGKTFTLRTIRFQIHFFCISFSLATYI